MRKKQHKTLTINKLHKDIIQYPSEISLHNLYDLKSLLYICHIITKTVIMDIITLNNQNLAVEHLCCAIDSKATSSGVIAKKAWLTDRINEGLKFKKLNARGKVFIEYIPVEMGWMPIKAKNYMLINCHWVSGSYKGKGYGSKLLKECENEAESLGIDGIVVVTANKKKPFLADKSFYLKSGYEVVDSAPPYFELLVKRFDNKAEFPQFAPSTKEGIPEKIKGIDIFYTAQCPFTTPYIELLKPTAIASDIPVRIHQIKSREEAQSHFCPVTTYSVFVDGKFHTQEILTVKKLEELIAKL